MLGEEAVQLLDTIPGVGQATAEAVVAEIGASMSRFPSAAPLLGPVSARESTRRAPASGWSKRHAPPHAPRERTSTRSITGSPLVLARRMTRRLQALGYKVTLEAA